MSKPLVGKLVIIHWDDHSSFETNRWHDLEESERLGPCRVQTVGWVVKDTKKRLNVVSTLTNNDSTSGEFCILKGTINKIKVLDANS